MKRALVPCLLIAVAAAQAPSPFPDELILLPGETPAAILVTPDGMSAIVNTCGIYDHTVSKIDLQTGAVDWTKRFDKTSIGIALTPDGSILTSAGPGGRGEELVYNVNPSSYLTMSGPISKGGYTALYDVAIPQDRQFVSGIAVASSGDIYVLNVLSDQILKFDSSGSLLTTAKTGGEPCCLTFLPGENQIAVTNWGDGSVSVLDAATLNEIRRVPVGPHPASIVAAPDGRIFVSNAGEDTIRVIDKRGVDETIHTRAQKPNFDPPAPLALSPNGKTLFVANSSENSISVTDISKPGRSRLFGQIQTSGYPRAVALTPDGRKLLVATGRGSYDPWIPALGQRTIHISSLMKGGFLEIIDISSQDEKGTYATGK